MTAVQTCPSNNPKPDHDPEVVIDFENLWVRLFVSQDTLQIRYGPIMHRSKLYSMPTSKRVGW